MKINEIVTEGKGLWANIHAKRERIKNGSGERMRKPGSKGAPTAKNFKDAANEGVAEGSLNEFAPGGNDGDDRDYEYEVYQCNPKDQFDWVGGPIYKTDDMAKAHGVAYNLNKKHPNKAFMIWQERSQGSRGGYGIKDDEQGVAEGSSTDFAGRPVDQELVNRQEKYWNQVAKEKKDKEKAALKAAQSDYEKTPQGKAEKYWSKKGVAEDSNEVDYPVELSAEIINWIKKTYPTATVAQLRDKSWIADKVKEYHREPKVLSGVRQAAQDAGRLEESMLEETYDGDEFYEAYGDLWYDEEQLNEAEYQGRKVQLGKPVRSSNGPKKFHVFVKDPSTGNVKKVNFGDKNMRIKKSDPARRKSFRARHNCANPGPRTKAKYWSCRNW